VRFLENAGNASGERALGQGGGEVEFGSLGGGFAGEPVIGLAEEIVAHFAPIDHVE